MVSANVEDAIQEHPICLVWHGLQVLAQKSQTHCIVKMNRGIHVHDENSFVHDVTVKMPKFLLSLHPPRPPRLLKDFDKNPGCVPT